MPVEQCSFRTNHALYFAESSKVWQNKGIAFLKSKPDESVETICELYRVTKEQFVDILIQENGEVPGISNIRPDFENTTQGNHTFIGEPDQYKLYGRLMCLGEEDGYPVYTFTSKIGDDEINPEIPGAKYLKTIGEGIWSNNEMSFKEVSNYLGKQLGVQKGWRTQQLENLFQVDHQNNLKVFGTNERVKPNGQFLAQLNQKSLESLNLTADRDVVLVHKTVEYELAKNPSNKEVKRKIEFSVVARLHLSDDVPVDSIRLDQTLREAIGVVKYENDRSINCEVSIRPLKLTRQRSKSEILRFQRQRSVMRVTKATRIDMEVNICRIDKSAMECIGVDTGDKIKIESEMGIMRIRSGELTDEMRSERLEGNDVDATKNYRQHALEKLTKNKKDLPLIFLDLDARQELGVEHGDPIVICRSNSFAFFKNIRSLTIPLVAVGLALIKIVEHILENVSAETQLIIPVLYLCAAIAIVYANLRPIRRKFH